jgi:hypothetical protein
MLDTTPETQAAQLARSAATRSIPRCSSIFRFDPSIAIANHISLNHPLYQAAALVRMVRNPKTGYFALVSTPRLVVNSSPSHSVMPTFDAPSDGLRGPEQRSDAPWHRSRMPDRVHLAVNRDLFKT